MTDDRVAVLLVLGAETDQWAMLEALETLRSRSTAHWSTTNVGTPDGDLHVIMVVDRRVEPEALVDAALADLRNAMPEVAIAAAHPGSRLPDMPFDFLEIEDMWARRRSRDEEPPAPDLEPKVHRYLIGLMNYLDGASMGDTANHRPGQNAYVKGSLDVMERFGLITTAQKATWRARADAA